MTSKALRQAGGRPALRRGVRMIVASPDLIVGSSELDDTAIDGRLLPLLVPLVDGTRTVREIARALEGRASLIDVQFGLTLLEEGGWLASHGPLAAPAPLSIRVIGETGARWSRDKGSVRLMVTDDYRRAELDALDREARAMRRSWVPVKTDGRVIWIGPVIAPARSPCWRCVTTRIDRGRPLRAAFAGSASYGGPGGATRAVSDLAVALARALLSVRDTDQRARLTRHIVTIDPRTLTSAWHEVVPDPDCPCQRRQRPSGGGRERPRAIRLRHDRTTPIADGGYRTVSPEETYRRYARHISPVTGIVRRLEPYFDDPLGLIHVYAAEHAFVVDPLDRAAARRGFRRTSTGKGMSAAQARASALCEALERYSGVYRGSEISRLATFDELGHDAIHPNACLGFSDRQFARRASSNRLDRPETWVPQPFEEHTPVAWTPAWSLTHARRRYLPTAFCYYGYPRDPRHDFCRADSNGTAAGNTIEEAILQGFFELVERDAVALWWYNRLARPRVDVSAFAEPFVRALIERYEGFDRRVDLLDLTTDLGVPVFAAISRERRTGARCLFGFGAHFDAEIAAARAVTEVNQFLPGALARPLADRYSRLAAQPFLNPDPAARPTVATDFRSARVADLGAGVRRAIATARRARLEMLVVDQTRPDIGLPVVKVVVPGLRPFWPRLAPGRLYDVPVKLGWRPRAARETDLNPVPFFI